MKPYFSWYSVATLCLALVCPATPQALHSLPLSPQPRNALPTPRPHASARPTESGYFDTLTVGGRQGRRFRSIGCQLDFAVRGSDCTLRAYFQAEGALLFSVDGQAYAPLSAPALAQWVSVPLFSGLTDSLHTVSLKQVGTPSQAFVDAAAPVVIQGRLPRLLSMPEYDPAHWGVRQVAVTDVYPFVRPEGGTLTLNAGGDFYQPGVLESKNYGDGSLICRATGRAVCAWAKETGAAWQARVDGVNYPVVTTPVTQTYNWLTLAEGLDANKLHEIVITNVGLAGWARLYSVMFPGGALSTLQPAPVRPVLMAFGHSIVAGAILPNLTYVYYQQMAQAQGYAIASRGVGGSTFVDFPDNPDTRYSTRSGQAREGEIVAVQPDLCILDDFTNDASNASGAQPPETPEELQAALTSTLQSLLAQCPHTRFIVLSILDKGKGLDFTAWNAAIAEAVAAQNAPRCLYVDQTGWIDPAIDTYDGTHPNIQGSQKIAGHLEPLVFPP